MNQAPESRSYFDQHLRSLGYLSRVRDVNSKSHGRSKAKPFLACAINSFHGDPNVENGIMYFPLDLIVVGDKAKEVVRAHMDEANDRDRKVLVSFSSGDHYIHTFERTGNRAGEFGAVVKGRLLKIVWMKVDGELVYRDEDSEPEEAEAGDRDRVAAGDDVQGEAHDDAHDGTPEAADELPAESGQSVNEDVAAADARVEANAPGNDGSAPTRGTERSNRYPALRRAGTIRRDPTGSRRA